MSEEIEAVQTYLLAVEGLKKLGYKAKIGWDRDKRQRVIDLYDSHSSQNSGRGVDIARSFTSVEALHAYKSGLEKGLLVGWGGAKYEKIMARNESIDLTSMIIAEDENRGPEE